MATYGVEYLTRLIGAVEAFEDAFGKWMETQVELSNFDARGIFPTVHTKDGQDPATVARLSCGSRRQLASQRSQWR